MARIRISATPARSIASRIRPLVSDSARLAASSLRASATAFSRLPAIAAVAARSSRLTSAAIAGVVPGIAQPDQFAIEGNLALHQRLGLFDQPPLAGTVVDGLDQAIERRQDRTAGMAIFRGEFLIAGERKGARRALRPVQQRPHVRNSAEHRERMVDGGGIRSRLDVQTDRGGADDEKDSEADSENDTLRRHCGLLISFREARGSCRTGDALIDDGQQRVLRERLAQAACRAEFDGHPQEIRRPLGVGEGVARHRDNGHVGLALVKHPN